MAGKKPEKEPTDQDRIAELEKQVAALKELMRANGWTV